MGITSLFKLLYLLFGRCGLFTAFSLYDFTQLAAVGSNQILFQRAGFEFHHNIVVIGRNQTVTSFKVSDLHCFSIGQVQGFLYPLGFVVLQIQNDLGLGVVDDALTKSAAVKVKEIGKILACKNRGAAVTAYGFGNFQKEIASQSYGQSGQEGAMKKPAHQWQMPGCRLQSHCGL